MESVKFSYTLNEGVIDSGIKLSGLFKPARSRQITLTALMALVIANAIYGTFSLKELTLRNGFYLVAASVIILLLWLEPILRIKNHKKGFLNKVVEIELTSGKISATVGEEKLNIIGDGLKGYREEDEFFIIYFAAEYLLLPKADKTDEELTATRKLLEEFHSIEKEES